MEPNKELDIDKTVDGIIDDILPQPENEDVLSPKDEDEQLSQEQETKEPELESKQNEKPALKEGDEGYVPPEMVEAPKSWSKEISPEFAKLAKPVQEYIRKREEDYTSGISQYKQAADYGNAVHSIVQPYMAHIAARGTDIPSALKYLLNADYLLANGTQENKVAFLRQVMQGAGITAEMFSQAPAAKDPTVESLERQVGEMRGNLTQFQQVQYNERATQISKAVDTFAADPKHLYFAELSADIVKLINVGYTLEESYEKALWANPLTRAKEQARLDKEKSAATKEAARMAAEKAKRVVRSNVRETPSSRSAPTGLLGSIDDTLRSTLRTINERNT